MRALLKNPPRNGEGDHAKRQRLRWGKLLNSVVEGSPLSALRHDESGDPSVGFAATSPFRGGINS